MPLEIEVKIKVPDHAAVRERLRAVGAQPGGTVREINIFFDTPDHALRTRDVGLRVRFSHRSGDPAPAALLTAKGPPSAGGLRSREAFDVALVPHDQIVPLLGMLGYGQVLLFEKDRETWRLDDCLVELDTLPVLGTFMEIEGPSEQAVQAVQKKLGLDALPPHRPSYSRMAAEVVAETAGRELRFS